MSDDARWLDLAGEILDGTAVEWDTVSENEPDAPASLDSLRLLSAVAAAHREADDHHVSWGSLELLEEIGSGAFGIVYRARDTALDRDVALKLLDRRPGAAALEEGRFLARVRHPNVVTVHGAAEHNGRCGIWMEFVRGRTLRDIVAAHGPMPIGEVIAIGTDICLALAAVHDAGLIHGDLKAQNVMRDEDTGRIVLMDVGTGRFAGNVIDSRLAGTPLYLAPEVLEGARADVRADIYSLGVLLYYLLTGAFPVEGADLAEICATHDTGSRAGLLDRRRNVPSAVASVIERALATDPEARFDSAVAFEHALAAAARLRVRVASMVAGVLLLGAGAGLAWTLKAPSEKPLPFRARDYVLIGAFDNRTGSSSLNGAVEAAVERELTNSQFVNVAPSGRIEDALQLMAKAPNTRLEPDVAREVCLRDGNIHAYVTGRVDRIGGRFELTASVMDPTDGRVVRTAEAEASDDSALVSAIRQLSNQIRAELGESAGAISRSTEEVDKVRTPSLAAARLFSDGRRAFDFGDFQRAEAQFIAAIQTDGAFASAHIWLAYTRSNLNRPAQQYLASAQRAMDLAGSATEREREWIAGSYYEMNGRDDLAAGAYEAGLRRYPDDFWELRNLSDIYLRLGRQHEAVDLQIRLADAWPNDFLVQAQTAAFLLQFQGVNAARARVMRARQLMPGPNDNPNAYIIQAKNWALLFPAHELWIEGHTTDAARVLNEVSGRPEFAAERRWTLFLLGKMRLALGQLHLAEDTFDRISDPGLRANGLAEVALARDDPDRVVALLDAGRPRDLSTGSLLVRAGNLNAAAHFLSTLNVPKMYSTNKRWSADEIEEARGNRGRIEAAMKEGVPWTKVMTGARAFMYSETLARAAAAIGDRRAAIKVLEDTNPVGPRAFGFLTDSGFYWVRIQKLLADLYREDGQIDKARAIERELLARLAVADPDYPLLVELKAR